MDDRDRYDSDADRLRPRTALTPLRVAVRFVVCVLVLVAIDLALARVLPRPDFASDWRMPRELPTSELLPAIEHIETAARTSDEPVVVFLGASPTWGDAVENASDTVPAGFRRAASDAAAPAQVFNLASNGQLLGDSYFIGRRIADDADVLLVQLTYHGFNGEWRAQAAQRYPELPSMLGVPVDARVAATLGIEPSRRPDFTGDADRWLRSRWRLYGARDALASAALGVTPEARAYEAWQRILDPELAAMEEEPAASGVPLEELPPDRQMMVMDEFSAAADFTVAPDDSEVRMLERLAAHLAASGTRTVFYISPLNVEALESFELFDREAYDDNVATLRRTVESQGHTFLDLNTGFEAPSSAFVDINHTTPEGSELVAAELWRRTRDAVEVAP